MTEAPGKLHCTCASAARNRPAGSPSGRRRRLEALEEDTEEAFLQRRELVKLLVERITISGGEDGQVKIDITYKFRPPDPEDGGELCAAGNTLRSGDRT
jgi:hypothetical protein